MSNLMTRETLIASVGELPASQQSPVARTSYIVTTMSHAAAMANDPLTATAARAVYNRKHTLVCRKRYSAAVLAAQVEQFADAILAERARLQHEPLTLDEKSTLLSQQSRATFLANHQARQAERAAIRAERERREEAEAQETQAGIVAGLMLATLATAETICEEAPAWLPAPIMFTEEEWDAAYQAAFAEGLAREEADLEALEAKEDADYLAAMQARQAEQTVEDEIEAARAEGHRVYDAFCAEARAAGYTVVDVGGQVFAQDAATGVFYLDSDSGFRALTKRAVQALVNAWDEEDVTSVLCCSHGHQFTAAKGEDAQACPQCQMLPDPETPAQRTSRALRRVARHQRLHRKAVLMRVREAEAWEDWQAAESEVA